MATLAEKIKDLEPRFVNNLSEEQQKAFVRAAINYKNGEQAFYGMMADKRAFDAWKKGNPAPKPTLVVAPLSAISY